MSIEIEELLDWEELADVKRELNDQNFKNRLHGSRGTYGDGCRGPLCRKIERDRGRIRNRDVALAKNGTYEPGHWRQYDRDDLLEAIWFWHADRLTEQRKEARRELTEQ